MILTFINSVFAKETLFENPIELKIDTDEKLNDFCKKFIDDIDIEKYIKKTINSEYVPVSLDECLDVALLNNFNIKITQHDYLSSKYAYQYQLAKMILPTFQTTSYIADYQGQILVGNVLKQDFSETALSINLTAQHFLTRGGRDIFETKAQKYLSKSKNHTNNFSKEEVIYKTARYYYEMLLAKINIEIYLRNLIERNAQLTLSENLKNSGFGTNFDVIRSKNESAIAKNNLLVALNQFRISQSRLANLMGIDIETHLMPFENEALKLDLVDVNTNILELFKTAIENREDLKALKAVVNYEKQKKSILLTDFIPKPLINFQQQFQGTLPYSILPNYIVAGYITWAPGENLSIGTIKKIKEQKEIIKTKELELINKSREIEQNLVDALSTSNYSLKEIENNKKRIEYSQESIKLAMLRFNNGKGILLDIIQAQSEMTSARVQYVSSIINYNISQLEILFNTGTITKDIIIENYKP